MVEHHPRPVPVAFILAPLLGLALVAALPVLGSSLAGPTPVPTPTSYVEVAAVVPNAIPTATPFVMLWEPVPTVAYTQQPDPTKPPPPPIPPTPTVAEAQAWTVVTIGQAQSDCLWSIAKSESRWRVTVWNHSGSGAYGLWQAKPASKMAAFGADYMTNPITQARWAISYATRVYGSPCQAWAHQSTHGNW